MQPRQKQHIGSVRQAGNGPAAALHLVEENAVRDDDRRRLQAKRLHQRDLVAVQRVNEGRAIEHSAKAEQEREFLFTALCRILHTSSIPQQHTQ